MAKPGNLIQVAVILTVCWSVVQPSSSAKSRDALLAFKTSLTDPDNRLSSWRGQGCCQWDGVQCSNQTGHVVKLTMYSPRSGPGQLVGTIGGEVPSSLLELRHLEQLDFSVNNLTGSLPDQLGLLSNLTVIDFINNRLSGEIPSC
ncbi:hypothetical protein SETIT_5G216000v2 [Setaria italica]|uniref:Leucine-rich repeat-containing N-terminal plant-type domain-containing protein n=1 Tax=Setaria italica TaxID=4555 RepID=K3XRG2_SETIT|nr:hypothetical protein SETIT_5G216000v2 [Setaria italica]